MVDRLEIAKLTFDNAERAVKDWIPTIEPPVGSILTEGKWLISEVESLRRKLAEHGPCHGPEDCPEAGLREAKALSPSPTCPHKDRALTQEALLRRSGLQIADLQAELASLREVARAARKKVEDMKSRKDVAYAERNRLVAFLANLYPSHMKRHPEEDLEWERDWMNIVCVHGPAGQMTWHIHDSQVQQFGFLNRTPDLFESCIWDGHTTEEKYLRLANCSPLGQAISSHESKWPGKKEG